MSLTRLVKKTNILGATTSVATKLMPGNMGVLMVLGLYPFMLRTTPFQSIDQETSWRWAGNQRAGRRASYQFLGPDQDKVTISGVLVPELTGGTLSLAALTEMGNAGKVWPLIRGDGWFFGMYIIKGQRQTGTLLWPNGAPRRIEFSLELERTDDSTKDTIKSALSGLEGLI